MKFRIGEGFYKLCLNISKEERQHTKLRTKNKMKQEKGITLIALVVTIVVLLILAGISIQTLFGNDGIFHTANYAVTEYEKQVVADKFNVHILAGKTDKILGKSNNISDLWQKLQDGGIIKNKEADVSAPISTSQGTIYEVSTTDGYIVEVIEDEKADVIVGEIYKADKMPPRIVGLETSKTTSSIHVEVKVQRLNEGKITYSYKKQEETTYKELKTSKDLTADFTGLEQNVVYNIQIVANNKNGKSNTETIHVLTGSLKSGTVQKDGETLWNPSNHTATIKLKTTQNIPQGSTLQYQVNSIEGTWNEYNQATGITGLSHGNTVYVRIFDGNNETSESSISIEDKVAPTVTVTTTPNAITTKSITVNVTSSDNQSGMEESPTYSYYIKKKADPSYPSTANYTGTNTSYTFEGIAPTLTGGLEANTEYDIKVTTKDVAQNEGIGTLESIKTTQIAEATAGLKSGAITADTPTWNPSSHTASVNLSTTTGLTIQWQKNGIAENSWTTSNTATGLAHGDTLYARLTDGKNEGKEASVSIADAAAPEPATISGLTTTTTTGQTITATVTHTDNQSGINLNNCKWIFDTNSGNLGTTNSAWNTATTFSNTSPINITVPNTPETYYLHVLSVDMGGNKREVTSGAVKVESLVRGVKVPAQSNGKTNVEWKETVNGKNKIAKIPVGFCVVKDVGTDINNIANGLVISDEANDDLNNTAKGNQFVWIPVENMNNFVAIEGFYNGSRDSKLSKCQEAGKEGTTPSTDESKAMYQSVAENGGFYIARFEAGIPNTSTPNKSRSNVPTPDGVSKKPVSKKGVSPWNYIPWSTSTENGSDGFGGDETQNGAVKVARSMYTKSNTCGVTSTLCYGVQWDAVMQFIEPEYKNVPATPEAETVPEDSVVRNGTGKGNYSGNLAVTGQYQQNHIYDLTGNFYEWTMEAYNTAFRVYRGGYCSNTASNYPASYRNFVSPDNDWSIHIGLRAALYM